MTYRELIGIPFVNEGRDPATGLDCWGLVMEAMRKRGLEVPDFKVNCFASKEIDGTYTIAIRDWQKIEGPEEGAVVAMANDPEAPEAVTHFGVCIGGNRFLHTLEKIKSCTMRLDDPFWSRKIRGFYKWAR